MIITETEHLRLRDFTEADIPRRVEWELMDREWQNWDGPWVFEGMSEEEHLRRAENMKRTLKDFARMHAEKRDTDPRFAFQLETKDGGEYIGHISCYCIDDDFNPTDEEGHYAFGISIIPVAFRGRGYGCEALRAAAEVLAKQGLKEMYVQTWSGNTPMIALAEKLGFRQVCRKKGIRTVRGRKYDALTFRKELGKQENECKAVGRG